jgi:flagellar biogenesis protein FliO
MRFEKDGGMGKAAAGGLAGWLLEKLRRTPRSRPRLALLERIALAPRQSLALIEADGRRFLVATSPEGAPVFYALDAPARANGEVLRDEAPRSTSDFGPRLPQPAARARKSRAVW